MYAPLNSQKIAVVYLVPSNKAILKLNFLQERSTIIQDKEKEDDGKGNNHNNGQVLDMQKIADNLKGLVTYSQPTKYNLRKYTDDLNPIVDKNNILILIVYLFCFFANIIALTSRSDSTTVYNMIKQVQLFTFASLQSELTVVQASGNLTAYQMIAIEETTEFIP